jgi:tetratricopeptide (TPR) repeat protein
LEQARGADNVEPDTAPRTLYDAARRAEASGDLQRARLAYFELVQKHPKSPLLPYVYFAFAELFFRESATHSSKLALAQAAYDEVRKYPPPGNRIYLVALARVAEVHEGRGEFEKALGSFKATLDGVRNYPQLECVDGVARAARAGMVRAYAEAGRADRAAAFFRKVDADAAGQMLEELADELAKRGQQADACIVAKSAGNPSGSRHCP